MDPKALHLPDTSGVFLFDLFHFGWGVTLAPDTADKIILDRVFNKVIHQWTDPERFEHTLNNHLIPLLDTIIRSAKADPTAFDSTMHLRATILGAFYHDYEYDTKVSDSQNVQESAEVFRRHAKRLYGESFSDPAITAFIQECIYEIDSTDYASYFSEDRPPMPFGRASAGESMRNGLGLTDFDLMSLGGTFEEFRIHAILIRNEWPHVSDHQFRLGRMAFLAKFLRVPRLFHPRMAELEAQACA